MLNEALGLGAGVAGGSLLGQILEPLSAPRKAIWSALGLPDTGSALLAQLGMDPNSGLTQALGAGVEMLGDPLTYIGGLSGFGLGHAVGNEARTLAAIEEEVNAVNSARQAAESAVARHAQEMEQWAGQQMAGPLSHANVTYDASVAQAMPSLAEMPKYAQQAANAEMPLSRGGLTYNRIAPDLAGAMDNLQMGIPNGRGGMQMNMLDRPSFAHGPGGYMKFNSQGPVPISPLAEMSGAPVPMPQQTSRLAEFLGQVGSPIQPNLQDVLGGNQLGGAVSTLLPMPVGQAAQAAPQLAQELAARGAGVGNLSPLEQAMLFGTAAGTAAGGLYALQNR